jgi:hypothetical protein
VQKESNENIRKGAQASQDEITKLKVLYTAATDATRSMNERNEAVHALQRDYPAYFSNLDDEAIKLGKAKDGYDALVKSMIAVAINKAKIDQIANLYNKLDNLKAEYAETTDKAQELTQEWTNAAKSFTQNKELYKAGANNLKLLGTQIGHLWTAATAGIKRDGLFGKNGGLTDELIIKKRDMDAIEKQIKRLFDEIDISGLFPDSNDLADLHVSVPTITVDTPDIKFEPETIQEIKDEYKALQQQINATLGVIDRESRQSVVAQNNELAELAKQYEQGYITKAEYEKQKADITEKYIAQAENAVIDSLKRLGEQYKNDERLYPLIAAEIAEEEIKIAQRRSKRLAEIGEKSAEDRKRAEDELKQAIEQTWNDISGSVGQIAAVA